VVPLAGSGWVEEGFTVMGFSIWEIEFSLIPSRRYYSRLHYLETDEIFLNLTALPLCLRCAVLARQADCF
jgi:hypothetical protein